MAPNQHPEVDQPAAEYELIDTPIGQLLVAHTARGIVRIAFESDDVAQVLEQLESELHGPVVAAPGGLQGIAEQFNEYFAGQRREFDLELDYSLSGGFRQDVQKYLAEIPYGRTQSYQEVAESVGNPKAARAVGSACATNPIPIVLPCHRVVRTDGTLGGYGGGLHVKQMLLDLEYSNTKEQI